MTVTVTCALPRELAERALLLSESEPEVAEGLAREALAAVGDDDVETSSLALQALGMSAWERQAISPAIELLRSAVTVAVDLPAVAARARSRLAVILSYAGDDAGALGEAAAAAEHLLGGPLSELHHHMAGILERLGRLQEARALAAGALAVFRRAGDRLWQAKAHNNLGIVLAQLGQVAAAAGHLAQAERLYGELQMPLGQLKVRNNRAWLASLAGDVSHALQLHNGLQDELAQLGVPPGLFRLDHAAVLLSASLHSEALASAEQAASELEAEGMGLDRAEALLLASLAARLCGAYERARQHAQAATAAFEEQGRTAWLLRSRHALIEVIWATASHDESTETLAVELADQLEAAGWRDWANQLHLLAGRMALSRGDLAGAEARVALIRNGGNRSGANAPDLAAVRARILGERGATERARRVLRQGLRALEEQETLLGATELRVRSARHAVELADLGLEWALASGRPSSILRWAERRRAVSLRTPPVLPPRDSVLAHLLAERRGTVFALEQAERVAGFQSGPDHAAYRRVALLDARIRTATRAVRGTGVRGTAPAVTPSTLSAALGGRALVELVTRGDELGAVTIIDGRLRFRALGSLREIHDELAFTRLGLRRSMLGGLRRGHDPLATSLSRLDELIGMTIARAVGGREVVIVPVASLHSLPWGSLPALRHLPVTVAPSATTWLTATMRPRSTGSGRRVVVVAGPDLAHAATEAEIVHRITRARHKLVGEAATAAAVTRAIDGAAIVHLACHGRFHPDNPLFSSLQLVDGPLTVYELERLQRAPELVVLSACDSAVTAADLGDELIGLTATMLALGCRTLIGATAPIADASTVSLMATIHRHLAGGRSPAAAVSAARNDVDPEDRAAFATAVAFGCFGAGD